MMQLIFTPWRRFYAVKDSALIRKWLHTFADRTADIYRQGMKGPKSGRVYAGQRRRASAPGEYPAVQTGRLFRGIRKEVKASEFTVGTSAFYAIFLRRGTSKMQRRNMSDNALQEAMKSPPPIGRFAKFR